jgi:hypothetical protein
MAFGDSPHDQALRDAWSIFCRKLEAAGDHVFGDSIPSNPLQRAEGFRFLTQNLGQAFDLALETRNTRYPVIHAFCTPFCKLGGDNADFTYQQAWVDGESRYRITGNKGTAKFLNITVQGARPGKMAGGNPPLNEPFGDVPQANMLGQDIKAAWDGSFELFIGGPQRGPNWLPTKPDTRKLFIRQGFDRWDERPAQMRIERIDMAEPMPMPTPETIVDAAQWAGNFVEGIMADWPEWSYKYMDTSPANPNVFTQDDDRKGDDGNDRLRGRTFNVMCWLLAPDEALIVEFDGRGLFWMMTNLGAFHSSMDFLYRPVSYTPARSTVDSDGVTRLILCHDDPGYHNWMDTQGFELGNMAFRVIESSTAPTPRTRLVKRDRLAAELPADTARTTPEERVAQMWERYNAIRQRYLL